MPVYAWPGSETRSKTVDLPMLTVGVNDISVAWATPMSDSVYTVQCQVEAGSAGLGKITAQVKQGTMTAAGCTVTCFNALLTSLAAGARLHVTAVQLTE